MKPRLLALYIVVVLTPLILLTALGVRTASYERDRARRNLERVLSQSLDDVDGEIGVCAGTGAEVASAGLAGPPAVVALAKQAGPAFGGGGA